MISNSRTDKGENAKTKRADISRRYSPAGADAASGADAEVRKLSSGASVSGWPEVSGTSPASDAADAGDADVAVALAGEGPMLAGRDGAGGTDGMYKGPR